MRKIALALILWGCGGHIVVSGVAVNDASWNRAVEDVRGLAAFELECPAKDLGFGLLEQTGRNPTEILVNGCGRTVQFRRVHGGAGDPLGSWSLVSANTTITTDPRDFKRTL